MNRRPLGSTQKVMMIFYRSGKRLSPLNLRCAILACSTKLLSCYLGLEKMQSYLTAFKYGNEALFAKAVMPGTEDLTWLHAFPLKISPKEQIDFICKMVQNKFPISAHDLAMTKAILFKEELSDGWKLFGNRLERSYWTTRYSCFRILWVCSLD